VGVTTTAVRRLFYDARCGPCSFFARMTAGLSRAPLAVYPLDSPEADRALGSLPTEARYGSFHILEPGRVWTGPDAMPAWAGIIGGDRARRVAERARPVNRLLRRGYALVWEYRRARGCAADRLAPG